MPTSYPNIKNRRDRKGRLFIIRNKEELLSILEETGFTLLYESISDDALNRDNTTWTTLVVLKR